MGSRKIYGYIEPYNTARTGIIKVGDTCGDIEERIAQQFPTKGPNKPWETAVCESGIDRKGVSFRDHAVHAVLRSWGIPNPAGEWFQCAPEVVKSAIRLVQGYPVDHPNRHEVYSLRPAQEACVASAQKYFDENQDETPEYLLNCVPRFGKCFATYKLTQRMGLQKVLIVTRVPAVKDSWKNCLNEHMDFKGWAWCDRHEDLPILTDAEVEIHFLSIQDLQGDSVEEIKSALSDYYEVKWDLVVVDESHSGAEADRSKREIERIRTHRRLYLSGTPFRALAAGRFSPEQTFEFSYVDLQKAKRNWTGSEKNPYADIPNLQLHTYTIAANLRQAIKAEGRNEFDLNTFFETQGAVFRDEGQVREFLDALQGHGPRKPVDAPLKSTTRRSPNHMLWRMGGVAPCKAMANLLIEAGGIWDDYEIVVAAGIEAGIGHEALGPVRTAIARSKRTITLSCGKLQTGVTVREWDAVLLLCNMESPETYIQIAMRPTTPWEKDGETLKPEVHVFDFDPNRILKIYEDVSHFQACSRRSYDAHQEAEDLLRYLPILSDDGNELVPLDAEILFSKLGSSSPKELAGKLASPAMVDVSRETLEEISNDDRLLSIVGALARKNTNPGFGKRSDIVISEESSLHKLSRDIQQQGGVEELDLSERLDARMRDIQRVIDATLLYIRTVGLPRFLILSDESIASLEDLLNTESQELFEREMGLTLSDFRRFVYRGDLVRRKWDCVIRDFRRQKQADQEKYECLTN